MIITSFFKAIALFLAALSLSTTAALLPPAPSMAPPEGVDFIITVRTAKIKEAFDTAGIKWDLIHNSRLRQAFNPLPHLPDDAISSVVLAQNGKTDTRLISLKAPLTMPEFLKAAAITGTTGDDQQQASTQRIAGLTQSTIVRSITPQEFLFIKTTGGPHLPNPGQLLSTFRTATARENCLILASHAGSDMQKLLKLLKTNRPAGGEILGITFGLQIQDHLRLFVRARCTSQPLAEQLALFAKAELPPIQIPDAIPADMRPTSEAAADGKSAGIEIQFPRATMALSLSAMLHGMSGALGTEASSARAQRNAQNLASTYSAARAAGCTQLAEAKDLDAVIALLRAGISPPSGPFSKTLFHCDLGDDPALLAKSKEYLVLKDQTLTFIPSAGPETAAPSLPEPSPNNKSRLAQMHRAAKTAKARRNAQNIASCFAAAEAAGSTGLSQVASAQQAVTALVKGVHGSGPFSTSRFIVPLTLEEQKEVLVYLQWDAQRHSLNYLPEDR